MKIFTSQRGTVRITIFPEDPHVKSLASAILLKMHYLFLDDTRDNYNVWLKFREHYLISQKLTKGDLVCHYCGKVHLEIGGRRPEDNGPNNKNPNLATIDHVVPLSKGGNKYDESNLVVACKKCNKKKAAKDVNEFVSLLNK